MHPYTRLFVLPAAPDADNDITEGYEVGDVVHVEGGSVYDCRDNTEGAAVWEERTSGSSGIPMSYLDTDGTLAANSDAKVPSQKAVKTYVDASVIGLLDFKGAIDCSSAPNYPAALKGDSYVVSVTGIIGGALGEAVQAGDLIIATADNAGGDEASVGTSWIVIEKNLQGVYLIANNLSEVTSPTTARANLGLSDEAIQDLVAIMVSGGIQNGVFVTYDDAGNVIDYNLDGDYIRDFIFDDSEGNPSPIGPATDGESIRAARRDHVHNMTTGTSVLGGTFTITNALGVPQATGLSVALPSAGKYRITGNIRGRLIGNAGTAWWLHCLLRNTTDGADIANSERLIVLTGTTGLQLQNTCPIDMEVDVDGADTIEVWAARSASPGGSWTGSSIESNTAGRSTLSYEKIG